MVADFRALDEVDATDELPSYANRASRRLADEGRPPASQHVLPAHASRPKKALVALMVLAAVAAGASRLVASRAADAPERASTVAVMPELVGLGVLLPHSGVLTVAAPHGAGDARVASLAVREGDQVRRGDIIAVLDNEASLQAEVEAARAALQAREANRIQVRGSVAASRGGDRRAAQRAQVVLATAKAELKRTRALHEDGVVTERELEQRLSTYEEAAREVQRLRASGTRFAKRRGVQADKPRGATQRDLRAGRAAARHRPSQPRLHSRSHRRHRTPHLRPTRRATRNAGGGRARRRRTNESRGRGTRVSRGTRSTGPVGRGLGARPAAPLRGQVVDLGHLVTRQENIGPSPAANTDARVVRVTVLIEEGDLALARRLSQLQVTARFRSVEEI